MDKILDSKRLLTLKTTQKQLIRMLAHFPGNGRTVEGLAIIAPDYFDTFQGLYDKDFVNLVDTAIKSRKFFPTVGDLKQIETDLPRLKAYNPYGGGGSLPYVEDMSMFREMENNESCKMTEDNRQKIDALLSKIGKKMSGEDANRKTQAQGEQK